METAEKVNKFLNETIILSAYQVEGYVNKDRWVSYFWQVKLIKDSCKAREVLEISVGNKIVSDYLKSMYGVTTVDIIEDLKPDYVGSVEDMNFLPDNKFDVSLCAEVLEHLPFEKFKISLNELKRVSKSHVIISLPYWGYTFGFKLRLPVFGVKIFKFKVSGTKQHVFNGQHYWEIGKKGFTLKKIKQAIAETGLTIEKSFWDLDDPYHYYFVLKK